MLYSHLVDIFALVPQNSIPASASPSATTTVFPAQDAKLVRYQDVLSKTSASDPSGKPSQFSTAHMPVASDGWISDDDDMEEMKGHTPVKSEGIGPLLGGFADAEAAMK